MALAWLAASREALDRYHAATLGLALTGSLLAVLVATEVFPYHSLNHDEGVYLRQAELLLDGQVFVRPPVEDAFRPWFFVEDGDRLYAKYAPVTAAIFALGRLAGDFRIALAGVAAANVALTATLARDLFDGRTGVLAGLFLLASPLFLLQSGVYLPYAPTTALNLLFALAYLRAEREESLRWAAVAGAAVGTAFFSRPYTAVLFAMPFVAHAGWTLGAQVKRGALRGPPLGGSSSLVGRRLRTGLLGSVGVAVALAYNWYVTGSPLLFPYQAFAPMDGVGFGHRALLGDGLQYTLDLALRANAQVVGRLFTQWVVAGPLGTALAAVGVAVAVRGRRDWRHAVLAATVVSVVAGNVAFWGNRNILGDLAVQSDGLIAVLGPYYHFDLLVPTAIFAGYGTVVLAEALHDRSVAAFGASRGRRVAAALLVLGAAVGGGVAVATAAEPVARNDEVTQQLAQGYEPFAERDLEDALVYLPTPYGPWLAHPFQGLRNDPGFDGKVVYALDGERSVRVAEAFADRQLYRYVYRGSWNPTDDSPVESQLREIRLVSGEQVTLRTTLGIPEYADRVSLRASTDDGEAYYYVNDTPDALDVTVRVDGDRVHVSGPAIERQGEDPLLVESRDEVTLEAYVETGPATGFSYHVDLPVDREDGTIRALSPYREYCTYPRRCDGAAGYLGSPRDGIFLRTSFENETATATA